MQTILLLALSFFLACGWLLTLVVLMRSRQKIAAKRVCPECTDKERQMMTLITGHVVDRKGYLHSGLTLGSLSNALGVNSLYLSHAVNRSTRQHFRRWLNGIRIMEAISTLSDPARTSNFSEIAYDVGFNDRTTFYRAFRQFTGTSPRDFCRVIEKSAEKKRCDS